MHTMKSRLILVITVLMLVSLSCQAVSFGQDIVSTTPAPEVETATPIPTAEPPEVETATPIPTAEPPEVTEAPPATETSQPLPATLPTLPPAQPGPDSLELAQLSEDHGLSDFTENITVNMTWTDSDGVEQQATTLFSHHQQSVPAFAWSALYDDQNMFWPTRVETALVNGQAFSTSSDDVGCNSLSADQVNLDEQRQSFRDLIDALTGQVSKTEADVDLGELTVDAYLLEAVNLTPGAEVEMEGKYIDSDGGSLSTSTTLGLNEEDVVLETGMLFLAQQGGFVARIELLYSKIAGEEDSLFAQPGTRMERMIVYEVLPATVLDDAIIPPAGCESATNGGGLEGGDGTGSDGNLSIADIPRLGDTTNVVETSDNLIYSTDFSMDEVVDFYNFELGVLGWEVEDEFLASGLATLEFVYGDQTIFISIIDTGDGLLVTVEIY